MSQRPCRGIGTLVHPLAAARGSCIVPSTVSSPPRPIASLAPEALAAHRAALWRYLRTLGADAATADDLVQEAFVVALRRADFDAGAPAAAFAFLRTTARHLWLKSRRGRPDGQRVEREVDEAEVELFLTGSETLTYPVLRGPFGPQEKTLLVFVEDHGTPNTYALLPVSDERDEKYLQYMRP